eukprot:1177478-Prorocentrum_minimum.AAC.2
MGVLNASGRAAARVARSENLPARGTGRIVVSASIRDYRCCGSALGQKEVWRLGARSLGRSQSGAAVELVQMHRSAKVWHPHEAGAWSRRKTTVRIAKSLYSELWKFSEKPLGYS